MAVELDHIFVCCAPGAPEASILLSHGLVEGLGNTHPGQGTANRRFVFANSFLELLWVCDPAEAQREPGRRTQVWDRWQHRERGACPFGLVFRPQGESEANAPFATWTYQPPYLPEGLSIEVGTGVRSTEPLLYYLPFARLDRLGAESAPGQAVIREIESVTVSIPDLNLSDGISALVEANLLRIRRASAYLLEIGFRGARKAALDLRPYLPLVLVPEDTRDQCESLRRSEYD